MKLTNKDAAINGGGSIHLVPEQADDVWALFTCIAQGDVISTSINENQVHYKKTAAHSIDFEIQFMVQEAEYDPENSEINIHGSIISKDIPPKLKRIFHHLKIKQDTPFMLTKDAWSSSDLDSLFIRSASSSDDLAVVLIPEHNVANIFLAGKGGSLKICANISKENIKYGFFCSILTAFQEHVDFKTVKHVVIAGPTGIKEKFREYLFIVAKKWTLKSILDNKSKFFLVSTNSRNFKEILEIAAIKDFVKQTEDVEDSSVMDELDFLNATDPDRACYGWKSVEIANELAAIRTLVITEDLYRSHDVATRKKYATLLESLKKYGGKTRVLFCERNSGKRLQVLTGVAAILRFRVPDLDDIVF